MKIKWINHTPISNQKCSDWIVLEINKFQYKTMLLLIERYVWKKYVYAIAKYIKTLQSDDFWIVFFFVLSPFLKYTFNRKEYVFKLYLITPEKICNQWNFTFYKNKNAKINFYHRHQTFYSHFYFYLLFNTNSFEKMMIESQHFEHKYHTHKTKQNKKNISNEG